LRTFFSNTLSILDQWAVARRRRELREDVTACGNEEQSEQKVEREGK
jgi:hypothetical protein